MLSKTYNPKQVEDRIYRLWEKSGFFNPDKLPKTHKKPFTIVLPPPNVTGTLHMGSALMLVIQDIIIRFERMCGKKTLWLPGTDHASIATETKFLKERKISKNDYINKRDEFIKLVNDFAMENQGAIIKQMRAMGSSLDWSRLAYTLDVKRSRAVRKAFIKMHGKVNGKGLIYMGKMGKGAVVNWDIKGQTVVSDDEIEYEPGKAILYTFRYSKDFPIAISTTRPETKVGDTAVAVNPDDERYKKYIGQTFNNVEFVGIKLNIKIVGDPSVDPKFGTGALGVTPAHSKIDSDIASRHNLPRIQVIDESGHMNEKAGPLADKKTVEAREIIVNDLKEHGLIEKEEIIEQNIPRAQRSGGIIEALPKRHQFFIDINKPIPERENKTLKQLMREAITNKKIKILPKRFEKIYLNWIENLRDWSISRQIWYGHRLPVWGPDPAPPGDDLDYVVSENRPIGKKYKNYKLFSDTLDTWFSSSLWPFSTLGWPEKTKDFKTFFPNDVIETAYDILFFWVARMILMSQFLLEEVPFKTVYLHGLVRDERNRKISKSLGNNIDPIDMINQYGADAVRIAMIVGTSPGNDSKISMEKFKAYKHFSNKIWNASRFVLINLEDYSPKSKITLSAKDKKTLKNLEKISSEITKLMENFRFYRAAEKIYHYFWHTFCDKIIEENKKRLNNPKERKSAQQLLLTILSTNLKLLHPFMPFITEEIYQKLPLKNKKKCLMIEEWPQ